MCILVTVSQLVPIGDRPVSMDTWHALAGLAGIGCITGGAWVAFGHGYGLMALGAILLSGVVYARTRGSDARQPD